MHKGRSSTFARADTPLPPGFRGPAKGEVLLVFRWTSAPHKAGLLTPSRQQATVTWWGQSSASALVALDDLTDTSVIYSVTCGPKAFSRYLQDMHSLKLEVALQYGKVKHTAQQDVDICKLSISTPVKSKSAVTASDGRLLGTAAVTISMSYTPLVSSFEMNEHLASIDQSMPLFPRTNRIITPLRQLKLQAGNSTPSVASSLDYKACPVFQHQLLHNTTALPAHNTIDQTEQSLSFAFEQLLQAIDREDSTDASLLEGLRHGGCVTLASLQKLLQRLPNSTVSAPQASFMTAMIAGRHQVSFTLSQLTEAVRKCAAGVERGGQLSVQGAASCLHRLALLLTQRQLDVQKAFACLDQQRMGSIEPAHLVSLLEHIDPAVSDEEVQSFVWRLWFECHPGARISMQDIKAVLLWVMQADAYPDKDFVPKTKAKGGQHGSVSRRSPPQTSRKRKAQHASNSRADAQQSTAGGSKSHKVDAQQQHISRTDRLKRFGHQSKQPVAAAAIREPGAGNLDEDASHQQTSMHPSQLPQMVSSLDAHVNGIPHTQLVQHTMEQLSHFLSPQPVLPNKQQPRLTQEAVGADFVSVNPSLPAEHEVVQSDRVSGGVSGAAAPVLQPFLAAPLTDTAQYTAQKAETKTGADTAIQHRQTSSLTDLQSANMMEQGDGQSQATGQVTGQAEGQAEVPLEGHGTGQSEVQEGVSSVADGQQLATGVPTGSALQQLISRAQKLKEQLDAHAQRKASRPLAPASAVTQLPVPGLNHPALISSSVASLSLPSLPRAGQPSPSLSLQLSQPANFETSSPTFSVHPSTLLSGSSHTVPLPAAASQDNSGLPPGMQLAQPSLLPSRLPVYTADTYSLMKGSLGPVSTWPQLSATALSSLPAGLAPAYPSSKDVPAVIFRAATSTGLGELGTLSGDDASSVDSDPAALVEDALLGELFFQQLQAKQDNNSESSEARGDQTVPALPDASLTELPGATHQAEPSQRPEHAEPGTVEAQPGAGHASHDALPIEADNPAQAADMPGVSEGHIQVTVQKADVSPASSHERWSLTLKAMCRGHPDSVMLQSDQLQQLEQQLPLVASVAAPAGLASAARLHQELCAVLEVWHMDGRAEPHGRLAGIVKVPLDCAPTIVAAGDPVTLAQGCFDMWDVFQSKAAGSLTVKVAYQPGVQRQEDVEAAPQAEHGDEEQEMLHKLAELALSQEIANPATGQAPGRQDAVELGPPDPVDAVMCVEIIRASGLLAAVNEASIWLGGGSSLLGRAKQLGPHSFVHLSLFPASEQLEVAVPPLQTSFQAQTFCPEFHFRRQLPLQIDARVVRELATQELLVEVWHHCPRSQAVAAALSQGGTTSQHTLKHRDVFLGSGFAPLHALLNKPQGLSSWVGLKSRRGEPVGAVQIKVSLTQLKGQQQPDCRSVFAAMPELTALLPPEAPPQARPFSPGGFLGQQARGTVYIEEVALPQADEGVQARPKSAVFYATYRLPGSATLERSACKNATSAAGAGGSSGAFRVALGHCGIHWVTADESLIHALQVHPMQLTVYKQGGVTSSRSSGKTLVTTVAAAVPLGSAEVDLSPLLVTRTAGKEEDSRWLSGTYLLVHPAAKHLGNSKVRVKVLLELKPHGSSRASSRQWQVPQVAPSGITAQAVVAVAQPEHLVHDASASQVKDDTGYAGRQTEADEAGRPTHHRVAADMSKEASPEPPASPPSVGPPVDGLLGAAATVSSEASSPTGLSATPQPETPSHSAAGNSPDGSEQEPSQRPADNTALTSSVTEATEPSPMIKLCIEQALHLALPPAVTHAPCHTDTATDGQTYCGGGSQGLVSVTFVWQGVEGCTPAVATSEAGSATWQCMVDLPAAQTDTTFRDRDDSQLLSLQVRVQGTGQDPDDSDSLGAAHVDLSLLHVMGHVSGWYNITNSRDKDCGQLKVSASAPGYSSHLAHIHKPGNTISYLDSSTSLLPGSPATHSGRLKADINTVAAPGRAASLTGQSEGKNGPVRSSPQDTAGSPPDAPGAQAADGQMKATEGVVNEGTQGPVEDADPRVVLRSQMQQLSELSHLLSERLHVSHDQPSAAVSDAHRTKQPDEARLIASTDSKLVCTDVGLSHPHADDSSYPVTASRAAADEDTLRQEEPVQEEVQTGGYTVRTVTLAACPEAAGHSAAGLHWGAQSDDEEDFGAPAMDGYTSSSDSYGGHMGGFAFEGAVSEADAHEADYTRAQADTRNAAVPTSKPLRHTISSFMDDDWMFGCQKSVEPLEQPRHCEVASDSRHVSVYGAQAAQLDRQLGQPDGLCTPTQEANMAGSQPMTLPLPTLRPIISFANALPPIPVARRQPQAELQGLAAAVDASQARQQIDVSVTDWLSHQVSGELLREGLGSGHSLAELATDIEKKQDLAAAGAGHSSLAEAPAADQQGQGLTGAGSSLDEAMSAVSQEAPGTDDDYLFTITASRHSSTTQHVVHRAGSSDAAAPPTSRQQLADLPEPHPQRPAQGTPEVPASVREAVDRFESWSLAQSAPPPPQDGAVAAAVPPGLQAPEDRQQQQQRQQDLLRYQHSTHELHGKQQEQQAGPQLEQQQCQPPQDEQQPSVLWAQSRHQEPGGCQHGEQHGLQTLADDLPQQQQHLPNSLRCTEQQQAEQQDAGAHDRQRQSLPEPQTCSASQLGPSSALSLIEATLAAINDTQEAPAPAALPPPTRPPSHSTEPCAGLPTAAAAVATGSSQRPPLPANRPGPTLSSRPAFAAAFANPSLYQQPWLCPATSSQVPAASLASLRMHSEQTDVSVGGPCSSLTSPVRADSWTGPCNRLGLSSQGSLHSSRHEAAGGTPQFAGEPSTALTHGARHPVPEQAAHSSALWTAAQHDSAVTAVNGDTLHLGQTCDGEDMRMTAAQLAYRHAKYAPAEKPGLLQPSADGDGRGASDGGTRASRWSAVNAYRQAREAAERAAPGGNGAPAVMGEPREHGFPSHPGPADASRAARSSAKPALRHEVPSQNVPPNSKPSTSTAARADWRSWLLPDAAQPSTSTGTGARWDRGSHACHAQPALSQATPGGQGAASGQLAEATGHDGWYEDRSSHGRTAPAAHQHGEPLSNAVRSRETDRISRIMSAQD